MTEIRFYHLQRRRLESALPELLEKSLERGWRCVVQLASDERLQALDGHLWTYSQESFLLHGSFRDPHPEDQPVYLTTGPENPNDAPVRFLVEGAEIEDFGAYERVVFVFDDADQDAVDRARAAWKAAKAAGHEVTYWKQDASGRWQQQESRSAQ